ncbi:MAG: carbon-nitrogen hydrolase family protein [Kiritimatiellaeota bacterium]|nr:carbon-nitrogen hydrolase family protein [Kiritimatiellota bacterium]
MADSLSIALVQMHSTAVARRNIEQVADCLSALGGRCRLAVFPENVLCLGRPETIRDAARSEAEWWCELRKPVESFGGWAVFGGVPVSEADGIRNRSLVCTPEGVRARYDKIHLFQLDPHTPDGLDETALYTPGELPCRVDVEGWRVALSICYDLRFPELYRACAPADLILCTAAFTARTGRAHWELLLRARAVENLCYVAGVGQVGTDAETGVRLHGNSMTVGPWGRVLARAPAAGAALVQVELRKERLRAVRRVLPALEHRRPGFPARA